MYVFEPSAPYGRRAAQQFCQRTLTVVLIIRGKKMWVRMEVSDFRRLAGLDLFHQFIGVIVEAFVTREPDLACSSVERSKDL
jgi:hypothetical protein